LNITLRVFIKKELIELGKRFYSATQLKCAAIATVMIYEINSFCDRTLATHIKVYTYINLFIIASDMIIAQLILKNTSLSPPTGAIVMATLLGGCLVFFQNL